MVGSEDQNNIEENTHIAYLCDLLERIWGHGLKKREVCKSFEQVPLQQVTVCVVLEQVSVVGSSEGIRRAPLSSG